MVRMTVRFKKIEPMHQTCILVWFVSRRTINSGVQVYQTVVTVWFSFLNQTINNPSHVSHTVTIRAYEVSIIKSSKMDLLWSIMFLMPNSYLHQQLSTFIIMIHDAVSQTCS